MNTTRSRLEMIAKQQGMGFHVTEATCYLTADLFYVEVVLVPNGGVEEVKVAPQGRAPVVNWNHFYKCFFFFFFFPALRAVKDSDTQIDKINYGRIGCLIAGKEGSNIKIYYCHIKEIKYWIPMGNVLLFNLHLTRIVFNLTSHSERLYRCQWYYYNETVSRGSYPVFLPLNEVPNETLPACFLLKLQPAVPVIMSFVNKLSQITDVTIPDADLQWAPLPKLLTRGSLTPNSLMETSDEQDTIFTVVLYSSAQRATVMESVPFTHPAHVPAILDLLRHQCAINSLLRSCATPQCPSPDRQLLSILFPESDTSFSVTFHPPETDSLAVCEHLPVNVFIQVLLFPQIGLL
uniref:Mediator of RNA polymerase II transcription subunit 1 n=1 Tax=Echeneis naucrates TaxID=173247 RepID=A0A665X901_ECHNA